MEWPKGEERRCLWRSLVDPRTPSLQFNSHHFHFEDIDLQAPLDNR
ncbi:MAG: hypothetical protein OSA07_02225 [Pseudomonadales bacterium]|nr:hypothetical protein [Pseudomonadales bacterium]